MRLFQNLSFETAALDSTKNKRAPGRLFGNPFQNPAGVETGSRNPAPPRD
jgi:hypothetical protein